jgi:hypothetical protein
MAEQNQNMDPNQIVIKKVQVGDQQAVISATNYEEGGQLAQKLDSIENQIAGIHTHSNKEELDKIVSGDVAKWNANQANVIESIKVGSKTVGITGKQATITANDLVNGLSLGTAIFKDSSAFDASGSADEALREAKNYADTLADALKGSVTDGKDAVTIYGVKNRLDEFFNAAEVGDKAIDTLKEIQTWMEKDSSVGPNIIEGLSGKVDKVAGKGLSTNDFTNELKDKLTGIEAKAEVNIIESIEFAGKKFTVDSNRNASITKTDVINNLGLGDAAFADSSDFAPKEAIGQVESRMQAYTDNSVATKVSKVEGKDLISLTNIAKLEGIESGAQVNRTKAEVIELLRHQYDTSGSADEALREANAYTAAREIVIKEYADKLVDANSAIGKAVDSNAKAIETLITIDSGYATRINTLENHQTVYEPKVNNHLSDSSAHIEEEERKTWNATAKKKLVVENGVLFFK